MSEEQEGAADYGWAELHEGVPRVRQASVVQYDCPYCGKTDGCSSYALLCSDLLPGQYALLVERGFCRSGALVYRPINSRCCCPQLSMRVSTARFVPSKSQRSAVARLHREFAGTADPRPRQRPTGAAAEAAPPSGSAGLGRLAELVAAAVQDAGLRSFVSASGLRSPFCTERRSGDVLVRVAVEIAARRCRPHADRVGGNSHDPAGVARTLRPALQARLAGFRTRSGGTVSLADGDARGYLRLVMDEGDRRAMASEIGRGRQLPSRDVSPAHRRIDEVLARAGQRRPCAVRTRWLEPEVTAEIIGLYALYQTTVHRDAPSKCSERQFEGFLVNSPVARAHTKSPRERQQRRDAELPPEGSVFRASYLAGPGDERGLLVGFGVLDVLPRCLASNYFVWHPELGSLSLGVVSAVEEIELARRLQVPWYYIGSYVHGHHKMAYKTQYGPAELYDESTGAWYPLEELPPQIGGGPRPAHAQRETGDDPAPGPPDCLRVLLYVEGEPLVLSYGQARTFGVDHGGAAVDSMLAEYARAVGDEFASSVAFCLW